MSFSLGGIFSGQLQAAAYKNLNGVHGLAGWRWLFILDGCISLPIAMLGFALFPGLPAAKKPWWMTKEEHDVARRRVNDEGIKQSRPSIFNKTILKRVFTKWHFYLAVLMYTLYDPIPQFKFIALIYIIATYHHVTQLPKWVSG